jgi:cytochrome c biogenesis protein CcdA
VWLVVTGRTLGLKAASRVTITPKRNPWNVFLYGIVYAVGSLSCTLPVYLVVVGSALSSRAWTGALGQFLGYAMGMASVFIAVTVGAALIRQVVTRRLQGAVLYVSRFSSLLLVGVGIYLLYDWIVQTWVLA